MAARRGKSQARRHGSGGLPGWAWLVLGVLVTLLAMLLVPRWLKSGGGDGFFRPTPNPDARPAAPSAEGEAIAPDVAPAAAPEKPKAPQFDFYTLLPGQEVAMSDAELAASAKAEAAAQARAAREAAAQARAAREAAAAVQAAGQAALPAPLDATAAPAEAASAAPPSTATTAAAPAPANAAPATPTPPAPARYLLQAGAYGASGDAEAVKAKIALLGLNARVESAQIAGKTVYRVRLGPYGSAAELAEAKAKLADGGLPAIAVKTQ